MFLSSLGLIAASLLAMSGCSSDGGGGPAGPKGDVVGGTATPGEKGSVRRDYWTGLPGMEVFVLNLRDTIAKTTPPDGTDKLTSLQSVAWPAGPGSATSDWANNFGERIRGFIEAPTSGEYRFLVSGDNQVQFFLSTDETNGPIAAAIAGCGTEKGLCPTATAQTFDWVLATDFMAMDQTSAPITLEQGKKYFFDWYHREDFGNTHAMVKWAKPGDNAAMPASLEIVPGSVLYHPENFTETSGGGGNMAGAGGM